MTTSEKHSYSQLLREHPEFRKLFYAQTVSVLGDWFHTIALLGLVYVVTGSGLMIGLTLITKALPALLFSPVAGVLVDKWDRKKIMIWSSVLNSILVLFMTLVQNEVWILFVVNVLMALCTTISTPARQSVIPLLVPQEKLPLANSLFSTVVGVMSVLGASLGGVVTTWFGTDIAFFIDSASYLIAAAIIFTTAIPAMPASGVKMSFFADMKEGYRFVLKTPIILALVLVGASWGVVGGAYQVLLTVFGTDVFQAGQNGVGLLYAVQGLGVILGGLLVKSFISQSDERMKKYFGWMYLLQGVFFVLFALASNLILALFFLLLMRVAGGVIIPLDSTLIQKYTPQNMIGKVFTLHGSLYMSIMQFSMFFTGILLESMSPQKVGVLFGAICCVVSVTWLAMYYTDRLADRTAGSNSVREGESV